MAVAASKLSLSPQEYLELERAAEFRSEYVNGEVFAMSGGSIQHSLIAGNLNRSIGNQLVGRPCMVFTSDMKVWIGEAQKFAYPDVSALCGEVETFDEHRDVVTNVSFIAEVLSPSTEAYNRGGKFRHYRRLPSFTEYLLLSQQEVLAELYHRQADGSWTMHAYDCPQDTLRFESIQCEVSLSDVYDKVVFEPLEGDANALL